MTPSLYKQRQSYGISTREHRNIMQQHLGRLLDIKEVVHHINGDTFDNRLENLEVMSSGKHARLHAAKLNIAQVRRIKEYLIIGIRQCELAQQFGVQNNTISAIDTGISWKDIKTTERTYGE